MTRISLPPTPNLKSKVVEEKSPESREKTIKQMKYNKAWQEKNNLTRMTFRLPAEQRKRFEDHAKDYGESLTQFIIRSCANQIERDTDTKSIDLDKMLSE